MRAVSLIELKFLFDEFVYFNLEYQQCVTAARSLNTTEKRIICPKTKYAFHAELEIHLNCNFSNPFERWILYFTDVSLPPGCNYNSNMANQMSAQVFTVFPDKIVICHNAKVKYSCRTCSNEWTTARGRAIFQAEYPQINKYNILFINLCTQLCQNCRQEIQPSWYLSETVRVMKSVARILIERFYSNRSFELPRPTSPSDNDDDDEIQQRQSRTRGHHQINLCPSCQRGYCFDSHK